MKRIIALITCFALFFTFCSCAKADILNSNISVTDDDNYRTFKIEQYGVTIDLPNDWYADMENTELDLFCRNNKLNMGIYGILNKDLSTETDAEDVFEKEVKNDLERFENVNSLDHSPSFSSQDKEIKTDLYSVETKENKLYNYYVLVESKENKNVFLWITFGGRSAKVRDNFDVIEKAIDSIKF